MNTEDRVKSLVLEVTGYYHEAGYVVFVFEDGSEYPLPMYYIKNFTPIQIARIVKTGVTQ